MRTRALLPVILHTLHAVLCHAETFPIVVPAVESFSLIDDDLFAIPRSLDVVVDSASASVRDTDGLTLIPPSVREFAQTFANDVQSLFPNTIVRVSTGSSLPSGGVFISTRPGNFTLASGAATSEGYSLNVSSHGAIVTGSGARGTFWATRTLLQGLLLNNGTFPASFVWDQPSWETRGFMLGTWLNGLAFHG
jgi:hexosaminidase